MSRYTSQLSGPICGRLGCIPNGSALTEELLRERDLLDRLAHQVSEMKVDGQPARLSLGVRAALAAYREAREGKK